MVHVPTTLLGMVDAAIGGKTGVNLPEGKNLVGAFWQPAAVLCDLDALETLPERERRSGLGEMAKYHFLTGDDLMACRSTSGWPAASPSRPRSSCADEREAPAGATGGGAGGPVLNYGHTLAHALEIADRPRPAPRRGGGHRAGLRGGAGRRARPHRAGSASTSTARVVERYGLDAALPAGSDPTGWSS